MLNNNLGNRPLAHQCSGKCEQIEMEEAGELQTLAVSMASAALNLVLQVSEEDEKYVEHYVKTIHQGCDFIILKHREQQKLAKEGKCGRCHQAIKDFTPPTRNGMTAGYYYGWTDFMNPGERYVCDDCMFKDPRYIKVYGEHTVKYPVHG